MKFALATKDTEVNDKINAALANGFYNDPFSFEMRRLKRDCEQLLEVEPFLGWSLLGSFASAVGDVDEAERCFANSLRLRNEPVTHANYHLNLGNLGFFSKAHEHFVEHGHPSKGHLSIMSAFAQTTGSFQTAVAYTKEAEAMGIEPRVPISQSCERAATVLARGGVSDKQVALHMDAAGEVLRRRKMFYRDTTRVSVSDVEGVFVGVTCVFEVTADPMEVFEMNVELAMVEEEMHVTKSPLFDVMFKPV